MKTLESTGDERVAFWVRVQPRASRDEVVGWTSVGHLKVRITAPPVDDAANQHLIKLLAKSLRLNRADIAIATGAHSRTKRVTAPESCKNQLLSLEDI